MLPVTEAHSEPEDAEVVPAPVDLARRRRLEILIDPRVRLVRIALRVDVRQESLLGIECVPEAVRPPADGHNELRAHYFPYGHDGN